MKWEAKDLKYGEIVYEEELFTGKRKVILNGTEMTKEIGRTYVCPYGDEEIRGKLKGNIFTGLKLKIEDDNIVLVKMAKWYEILLSILIPVIIFGVNYLIIPLVKETVVGLFIGPVIVGAFTGIVSVFAMFASVILMKKMNHIGLKIFVWAGILLCALLLIYSFSALINL